MNVTGLLKTAPAYTRSIRRAGSVLTLAFAIALGAPAALAQAVSPTVPVPTQAASWVPATSPAAAAAPVAPQRADREWLKAVYEKVADSVVLVETELGTGSGFFFYSPRLVATALHVVDDADTIIVGTHDGRRYSGHVVAYSRDYDTALVELEQVVPDARLLVPYDGKLEIGETVAVIGHPFSGLEETLPSLRGLLNWSLTQGVVSAVAGSWLQTDAAINPGNSGGPVLNERGEVIGVVSAKLTEAQGIGMIARIKRVEELIPKIGLQAPPRQTFAFDGVELGFLVNWLDDEAIDGLAVGAGVRVVKRYPIRFRLGFLGGDIEPDAKTTIATRLERFSAEVTGGYAIPFGGYFELSPTLGAALFYDRRHDSAFRVDSDVTCSDPPCLVDGKVLRTTELDWRFLPTFGISLDFVRLRVAYAYQLDLVEFEDSEHRMLFAVNF